jgi:NADH-quinone oxidoreductase subunit G
MSLAAMLDDPSLAALWVVGSNPLRERGLASPKAFVVVQDMFLNETARRADVVFPSASAYEKTGTVTNVTGEVQRLQKGLNALGAKTDLDIFGLVARALKINVGLADSERIFEEIRSKVRGYNIPLPVIRTGGAAPTMPVNGRVNVELQPELVRSAGDTLFTSGSLGRYSKVLNSVIEAPGGLYRSK